MNHNLRRRAASAAAAALIVVLGAHMPSAQEGIKRTDIQTNDLSIPGHEVVQQMLELQPGAVVAKHTHPGEEITVVLDGSIQVEVAGRPAATYKAGEGFTIRSGLVHGATNTGKTVTRLLATYVVEKGKPLRGPAQ